MMNDIEKKKPDKILDYRGESIYDPYFSLFFYRDPTGHKRDYQPSMREMQRDARNRKAAAIVGARIGKILRFASGNKQIGSYKVRSSGGRTSVVVNAGKGQVVRVAVFGGRSFGRGGGEDKGVVGGHVGFATTILGAPSIGLYAGLISDAEAHEPSSTPQDRKAFVEGLGAGLDLLDRVTLPGKKDVVEKVISKAEEESGFFSGLLEFISIGMDIEISEIKELADTLKRQSTQEMMRWADEAHHHYSDDFPDHPRSAQPGATAPGDWGDGTRGYDGEGGATAPGDYGDGTRG